MAIFTVQPRPIQVEMDVEAETEEAAIDIATTVIEDALQVGLTLGFAALGESHRLSVQVRDEDG